MSVRITLCVNFCERLNFSLLMSRVSLYLCCSWWYSRNSLWQRLCIETMASSFTTSSYSVSTKRKEGEDKMVVQLCVAPHQCWILARQEGIWGRECVCLPLDGGEWSPSCLCHFTLWVRTTSTQYPLKRSPCGAQSLSNRCFSDV